MPLCLFLLAYHTVLMFILITTLLFYHYCRAQPFTGFNLKIWELSWEFCVEAVILQGSFLQRSGTPFHSISFQQSSSAFSFSDVPLNALNFMIHAMKKYFKIWSTENRMRLQEGRYLQTSMTTLESALSSVFIAFGGMQSSRRFTVPSGRLASPPVSISMCEQAQKERHGVHVWIRWQKVFSGSSLGTGCESEPLTLGPSEVLEVPQRTHSRRCAYIIIAVREKGEKPATSIWRGLNPSLVVKVKMVRLKSQPMIGLNIFDWIMAAFTFCNSEIMLFCCFCWCRFCFALPFKVKGCRQTWKRTHLPKCPSGEICACRCHRKAHWAPARPRPLTRACSHSSALQNFLTRLFRPSH